jgi:hypothetical protein
MVWLLVLLALYDNGTLVMLVKMKMLLGSAFMLNFSEGNFTQNEKAVALKLV